MKHGRPNGSLVLTTRDATSSGGQVLPEQGQTRDTWITELFQLSRLSDKAVSCPVAVVRRNNCTHQSLEQRMGIVDQRQFDLIGRRTFIPHLSSPIVRLLISPVELTTTTLSFPLASIHLFLTVSRELKNYSVSRWRPASHRSTVPSE